jgi:hypothetical protein
MKPALLLYATSQEDRQRVAVGPALAAIAARAGIRFECYYDEPRRGRHYGGGDPATAPVGLPGGSTVAGGQHIDHLLRLATRFHLVAVGDPCSAVWPALDLAAAEVLAASTDPGVLYEAVLHRFGQPAPEVVYVVDDRPQGPGRLRVAPYLAPAFLHGAPALGLEVGSADGVCRRLTKLGARRFVGLWVDQARASGFPERLDQLEGDTGGETYASLTARLAERHAAWGQGLLLADPDLAAAQLGRLHQRRLLPLYGRPQVDVIARASGLVRRAAEPVFGRQWDDRDFLALGRLGKGLQVVDPSPPFDATRSLPWAMPEPVAPPDQPSEDQLRAWAAERRILVTLCIWAGMVREIDGIPRLLDLVAATGLRAGLVITAETADHGLDLLPLGLPPTRGGVLGLVEPLLGSTGRGVAAETYLTPAALRAGLEEALGALRRRLPGELVPRGWWPLLDAPLLDRRRPRVGRRGLVPYAYYTPPQAKQTRERLGDAARSPGRRLDLHGLMRRLVRSPGGRRVLVPRRPFDAARPGPIDPAVADAVQRSGLRYMFTKAGFGSARVLWRRGEFVVIPFTAGNWDGWSPFYTAGSVADLDAAEHRLLRSRRPGWVVSTVDSPLFALAGEVWEHGARLHEIARRAADGGRSGRLVNVTPQVVARYARILDDQRGGRER